MPSCNGGPREIQTAYLDPGTTQLAYHAAGTASSGSSLQLVGRAPPIPEGQDGAAEQEMPRASVGRPHRCPMKARLMPGGRGGGSPPSSPECPGGADSDDYSTASESGGGCRHQRHQLSREKTGTGKIEPTSVLVHRCQCRCDL